jgi:alpha-N-arabinofuranosidase
MFTYLRFRTVFVLLFSLAALTLGAQTKVSVKALDPQFVIDKNIYGHFSEHLGRCIYDGFYADPKLKVANQNQLRLDVVDALKKIKIPMLRWPGGCFADDYHWMDGIGPKEKRPTRVNSLWGMVLETNSFGTHEFMELCDLLGCEPYIAGNVGSGTPQEMSNWIEYLNFEGESSLAKLRKENGREKPWKVSYWGVGNETWGCGGEMTVDFYVDQYKRFASFCKNYPGAPLKKIVSGSNGTDYNWTEVCMKRIPINQMWGISAHYYTVVNTWEKKGSATAFGEDEYFKAMQRALFMDELITKHSNIMDKYDPQKKVTLAMDEWGIWTDAEPGTNPAFLYQQNSLRDALLAAATLNIFAKHGDRVRVANLAQTVNVLQALILTDNEKMLLTPTYHVFDLYKVHQNANLLPVQFFSPDYVFGKEKVPAVSCTASKDKNGITHLTFVNLDPSKKQNLQIDLNGLEWKKGEAEVLTSAKFNDVNTFENPNKVKLAKFTDFKKEGTALSLNLPAMSVVSIELQN